MQPEWGHAPRTRELRPSIPLADAPLARSTPPDSAVADFSTRQGSGSRVWLWGRVPFSQQLRVALVGADIVATICGIAIASALTAWANWAESQAESLLMTALISLPVWPILYAHQGLYQARRVSRRLEESRRIVNSVLAGMFVLAGISVLLQEDLSRGWLLLVATCVTSTMILERELARRVIMEFRTRGVMTRRVVIVGRNEEATELAASLSDTPELGYEVVGFVADAAAGQVIDLRDEISHDHEVDRNLVQSREPVLGLDDDLGPYLGRPTEVLELVRATDATGVIVATTGIDQVSANRLIRDLTREGVFVELTSAMRDISSSRISVRPLGPYPVMCVEPVAQFSWRRVAKRLFDLVLACIAVVVFSPILIAAALAVRVTSGKGVLFSQERVGKDGEAFRVYKLRTMVHDAEARLASLQALNEAAGPMFKMTDDPRVTKVGRFLRASSIDELPQLFNVIAGDMSLVGPRPALPNEADQWDDALWERLRVQPGITGMWQVSGRYTASLETYARLDLYYVDNWSLVTDVAILVRTVGVVLRRRGGA